MSNRNGGLRKFGLPALFAGSFAIYFVPRGCFRNPEPACH